MPEETKWTLNFAKRFCWIHTEYWGQIGPSSNPGAVWRHLEGSIFLVFISTTCCHLHNHAHIYMHHAFQVSTVINLSPVNQAASTCCKSSIVWSNITQHLANFITPKARTYNLDKDKLCHTYNRTKTSYRISSLNKRHGKSVWLTVLNFTAAFFFFCFRENNLFTLVSWFSLYSETFMSLLPCFCVFLAVCVDNVCKRMIVSYFHTLAIQGISKYKKK